MDIAHKESDKILEELEKELKKLYSSCYKKNKAEFEKALNKLLKNPTKHLLYQEQKIHIIMYQINNYYSYYYKFALIY